MKKTILVLLTSILSTSLYGDCPLISRWGERGITRDLAANGSTLVAADGRGVAVYEVSNPASIRQTGSMRTDAPSIAVERSGGSFVVLTTRGVELFDVDPANGAPRRLWTGEALSASSLSCDGSLCATAGANLDIFLVEGAALRRTVTVPLGPAVNAIHVRDSHIFVGRGAVTTTVFDSNGTAIAELPFAGLAFASEGDRVFIAGGGSGVAVVDDSASPAIVAQLKLGDWDIRNVQATPSALLIYDSLSRQILKIDGATSDTPTVSTRVTESPLTMLAADGRLYTALPGRPVRIRDAGDLSVAGDFEDRQGPLAGVATDGSYAYVADPPLFRVIDVRDRRNPREIASLPLYDSADRVRLHGSMAAVYGRANVHLIDISQPARPIYLGVWKSLGSVPNAAAFSGDLLIEDNRSSGFHVVDISNPASPRQIGGLINDFYGQFYGVAARPGVAYGFAPRALKVIDLSDPRKPRIDHVIQTFNIRDGEISPATAAHPELLMVIDGDILRIFEITDPIHPRETSGLNVAGAIELVAGANVAYAATAGGDLIRIDLTTAAPTISHRIGGLIMPTQIALTPDEQELFVADGYSLIRLSDLKAAETPLAAPALAAENGGRTAARITWSSIGNSFYEVQTSADPSFSGAETMITATTQADVLLRGVVYARVRATNGCTQSDWSNSVRIDPAETGLLAFTTAAQRAVIRGNGPATISVTISNRGEAAAQATLTSSSAGVTLPASRQIAAASNGTFDVLIDPAVAPASIELGLSGSSSRHRITLTRITPSTAARAGNDLIVLAGVAATPGSNGTTWKSDLNLLCSDTAACEMELTFNAYGTLAPAQAVRMTLEAGEGVVIRDAVVTLFGASPAAGAVEIRSPRLDGILASAFTYNESASGRFGQRVESRRVDARATSGTSRWRLHGIAQNAEFRTNVGLVNTSGSTQRAVLSLRGAAAAIDLRPWEGVQYGLTTLFPAANGIDGESIEVTAPAQIVAYQSRVDQRTGDGTYSLAQRIGFAPSGDRFVRSLTAAVKSAGALGTFWRTAVQVANEGGSEDAVELTFVPAVDPSRALRRTVTLAPAATFATNDVLDWLGVPAALTYGWLRVESNEPFTGWGRIYNDAATGTFGQYVPMEEGSPAAAVREKAAVASSPAAPQIFPVSESPARRTNFGVAEVGGRPGVVRLKIYDSSGAFLGIQERTLAAFSSQVLFDLLSPWRGAEGLRVEIESRGEARVRVYASTVEASTGDAVFIPAAEPGK